MVEVWKDIPEYENLYQVSNLGRVRSLDRTVYNNGGEELRKGSILKGGKAGRNSQYHYVRLSKDGKVTNKYIHRLVAEAFIQNPENKPTVDHLNRDTNNNTLVNLRWATYDEQVNNRNNKNIQNRKPINIEYNGKVITFNSQTECAKYFGTSKNRINELFKGKRSEYKGIKISVDNYYIL